MTDSGVSTKTTRLSILSLELCIGQKLFTVSNRTIHTVFSVIKIIGPYDLEITSIISFVLSF